ncbi:MAG TPA: hypothetical protein DGG95_11765 [Cytophagales bacterium]|nr:hypothetical protein [Cytophagales bacterium]
MPSGEPIGYPQGHVNRVYDYVIVPACRLAGVWPSRMDTTTYKDPFELVKEIIDSEMVLCDISAGNNNALYGLAIRFALNLPVMLVKDSKSFASFDASEMGGIVEYDETLRIDTVQKATEVLSEALKKAIELKSEKHSLLYKLGVGIPQPEPVITIPEPTFTAPEVVEEAQPEEEVKPKEPRLPIISPLPDYVGDPFTDEQIEKLKAGDSLFHLNYGKGKINFIKKMDKDKLASIVFDTGTKLLVLAATDFYRKIIG